MPEGSQGSGGAGLARHLEAMGLEPRALPGGSLVVDLPFGPEPLETLAAPRRLRGVRFATVGADRIKCIAPRVLFYLPLIPITGCRSARDLEQRIRGAWKLRLEKLRQTRAWLDRLGVECESPRETPQWVFRLGLEDKQARASSIEPGRVILPSTGPLSGAPLERLEDRLFSPDPGCDSAVDLELAITTRLEELARYGERVRERRRRSGTGAAEPVAAAGSRKPPLLLVGPRLAAEPALQDSLRVRGLDVVAARNVDAAVALLYERSYEAVLADARLDRADGIELIPALRAVAGIEEIPVVLVDDRAREARRLAARSAGAAGYVTRPLDAGRLAAALGRLIQSPRRRRFTRYKRVLSVTWPGCREPGVTENIGRGGVLLRVEHDLPGDGPLPLQIHLPEKGASVRVEARVVSRLRTPGRLGVGLHFCAFPDGNERVWIDFLRGLEPRPEPAGRAGRG